MTIPPEVSNAQQGSVLFSFIHSYINVNDRAQKSVFPTGWYKKCTSWYEKKCTAVAWLA